MNGTNHQMNSVTTFPFYIFDVWNQNPPHMSEMPYKGDTIIGNNVWIGQNVTILPGINIGNSSIIGMNSVVTHNIPHYTIFAGNPAKYIRQRFDIELIEILEKLQWWDLPINEINQLIPILNCSDLEKVKTELKKKITSRK